MEKKLTKEKEGRLFWVHAAIETLDFIVNWRTTDHKQYSDGSDFLKEWISTEYKISKSNWIAEWLDTIILAILTTI